MKNKKLEQIEEFVRAVDNLNLGFASEMISNGFDITQPMNPENPDSEPVYYHVLRSPDLPAILAIINQAKPDFSTEKYSPEIKHPFYAFLERFAVDENAEATTHHKINKRDKKMYLNLFQRLIDPCHDRKFVRSEHENDCLPPIKPDEKPFIEHLASINADSSVIKYMFYIARKLSDVKDYTAVSHNFITLRPSLPVGDNIIDIAVENNVHQHLLHRLYFVKGVYSKSMLIYKEDKMTVMEIMHKIRKNFLSKITKNEAGQISDINEGHLNWQTAKKILEILENDQKEHSAIPTVKSVISTNLKSVLSADKLKEYIAQNFLRINGICKEVQNEDDEQLAIMPELWHEIGRYAFEQEVAEITGELYAEGNHVNGV